MREHVDIRKVSEVAATLGCFSCERPMVDVDTRQKTLIWYCSACDVFHETTPAGARLRSFRKEASQIVNLSEAGDGPAGF